MPDDSTITSQNRYSYPQAPVAAGQTSGRTHVTQPATTQELIADVLLTHLPNDDDAYTAADAILRDPALTIRPRRIIWGDHWETIRDALDALPNNTQIRWGTKATTTLGIKVVNVMGQTRWATTSYGNTKSETIARDNTPIEVIA